MNTCIKGIENMFRKQKCIYMYKYKPCNLHFIDPI